MSIFGSHRLLNEYAVIEDPGNAGALPRNGGYVRLVPTGNGTRTLGLPLRHGVELFLDLAAAFTVTITVTGGFNQAGGTVLTFNAVGQYAILKSVRTAAATFVWRLIEYTDTLTWRVDPGPGGALDPTAEGYGLVSTGIGLENRTMANPVVAGQKMTIFFQTRAAAPDIITVTFDTAFNEDTLTVLTFRNPGETATLTTVNESGNIRWRLVSATDAVLWRIDPGADGTFAIGSHGYNVVTLGVEARGALAIPESIGQSMMITMDTDAGDCTMNITGGVREGGASPSVLTLANVRDTIVLRACTVGGALRWRLIWEDFGPGGSIT